MLHSPVVVSVAVRKSGGRQKDGRKCGGGKKGCVEECEGVGGREENEEGWRKEEGGKEGGGERGRREVEGGRGEGRKVILQDQQINNIYLQF